MNALKRNSAAVCLLAASLCFTAAQGCDRYARHAVLTFFFTGVPPLTEENRNAREQEFVTTAKADKVRKQRVTFKPEVFSHGPFASGECGQCHETSETAGFRTAGADEAPAAAKKASVTGRLVAPLRELCAACHESKSARFAQNAGLRLHGPAGAGLCTACHSPHSSPNRYSLLKKSDDLCRQCHPERLLVARTIHAAYAGCLSCHNAHLGKNGLLLKRDYHEVR